MGSVTLKEGNLAGRECGESFGFFAAFKQKFKCHENPKINILRKFEVADYLKEKKGHLKMHLLGQKFFNFLPQLGKNTKNVNKSGRWQVQKNDHYHTL